MPKFAIVPSKKVYVKESHFDDFGELEIPQMLLPECLVTPKSLIKAVATKVYVSGTLGIENAIFWQLNENP